MGTILIFISIVVCIICTILYIKYRNIEPVKNSLEKLQPKIKLNEERIDSIEKMKKIDDNEEILDNAKDQIFHNPVEKYAIYAKFPFILFFQLLIIIFAMYRLINNTKENEEGRFFKHLVYELFLPLDDDNDQKLKVSSHQDLLYSPIFCLISLI